MSKKYPSSDRYFFDEFILIIIVSEYLKGDNRFIAKKIDEGLSNWALFMLYW